MIRYKKIRGHKRIWKSIDNWVAQNKQLDLDYLKSRQREYAKTWVRPYSDLRLGNSFTPSPKGKTRQKIIDGLFEIHSNWKKQLDTLDESYYLKIWFYCPDVSQSQVVCAIGDFINFYDITFHNPNENKAFPFDARNLKWEHRIHEDHFNDDDIVGDVFEWASEDDFNANKKWIEKRLKQPHRISKEEYDDGHIKTYHSFKTSDVWLGSSS
jgi:hypothetical protein